MNRREPLQAALISIFLFLVFLYTGTAIFWPDKYVYLTQNGLFTDKVQVISLAVTLLLSLRLGLSRSCHYWPSFLVVALVLLVAVSGQLSWGRGLFGLGLSGQHHQTGLFSAEKTAHLLLQPIAGWEMGMAAFWTLYGLVYPMGLKRGWRAAAWMHRGIPAPPLCLWPFYVCSAFFGLQVAGFHDLEVAGVFLTFALAATVLAHFVLHINAVPPAGSISPFNASLAKKIARRILLLFYAIVISAAGLMVWRSHSTDFKNNVEQLYTEDVIKFAEACCQSEKYKQGIRLYTRMLERYPDNVEILRRVASCCREEGSEKEFLHYYGRALRVDMAIFDRYPEAVSVNLSLARTYRLLPDDDKTRFHLEKALASARKKVRLDPDNAFAVYGLALTYQLKGERNAALVLFERAVSLNPSSHRFKDTLERVRRKSAAYYSVAGRDPRNGSRYD